MKIKLIPSVAIFLLAINTSLCVGNQKQLVSNAHRVGESFAQELIHLSVELIRIPDAEVQERFAYYCMFEVLEGFKMQVADRRALAKLALNTIQLQELKKNLSKVEQFFVKEVRVKAPVITKTSFTDTQKKISHAFFTLGKKSAQFLIVLEAYILKNPKEDTPTFDQILIDSCYDALKNQFKLIDSAALAKKEALNKEQEKHLQTLISLMHEMIAAHFYDTSVNI
ncbi:hypothetical protein H0X48_05455 [Candidatus Dependentiae bacterium]|nr:hypothetical protein [Candidatus Dependentiae bacterium]